jgi:hypothetical protein
LIDSDSRITPWDKPMIVRTKPRKEEPEMAKVTFIKTMDCLPVSKVPEGPELSYEIEPDGYRLEAVQVA